MFSFALESARDLGHSGRFAEMLKICQALAEGTQDIDHLLSIGVLLASCGFSSQAKAIYELVQRIAPETIEDSRAQSALANLMIETGEHTAAMRIQESLFKKPPKHSAVWHNFLTNCEYDLSASDSQRLNSAKQWGDWAIAKAGGVRVRPEPQSLGERRLRIGYVSADFCQHTVGLFVKDVIREHNVSSFAITAYSAGKIQDAVTKDIAAACTFKNVATLEDRDLVKMIRDDQIDILIDLSGHTAGSRLTAFAYRPAPVMLSWLGYFATTGLPYMDAVLLDEWHAPEALEKQFIEPIARLPAGRFCYVPVPWAPEQTVQPPCLRNGFVTFGSFNNTAKINGDVLDLWAKVLLAVPGSHLLLKWRTFNDDALREKITHEFVKRGISADRLELRGPSFHADMLKEYADMDIALDPFPFTGGLTSCEALWMGVPVITFPQTRVVSRQTFAILSQIGLSDLVADSAVDYLRLACEWAQSPDRLIQLRQTLRPRMQNSSLMDVQSFTRGLESVLIDIFKSVDTEKQLISSPSFETNSQSMNMSTIKINDKEYDTDSLSQEAKAQLEMLLATDGEIQRLKTQLAIAQTAKNAYALALAEAVK